MISKLFSIVIVCTLSLISASTFGCAGSTGNDARIEGTTLQIQKAIQSELDSMDRDLLDAAARLAGTGLSGDETEKILSGVCSKHPYLIDCLTADAAGTVTAVAPDAYRNLEGADLKTSDIKKPTLTMLFMATEGMEAVSLMQPILSEKGEYRGIISALFKPQDLLKGIVEPVLKGTDIEVSVVQLDGLTIYNSVGDETGMNIVTDPAYQSYKDLIEVNKTLLAQESGSGNYEYVSHKTGAVVKKLAVWSTTKLHDTAWRVISYQEVSN